MLDFSMSKEQKLIRDEFARLVKELVIDNTHQMDESGQIPPDLIQQVWEMGASILDVPERYGGYGGQNSCLDSAVILEELAFGDMAVAIAATLPSLMIQALLLGGTPDQQEKYLPLFCAETYPHCSLAISEQRFRFDPTVLKTSAVYEKDRFILNGEKCFVPMADQAEHFLVAANFNDRNHLFIVSKDNPGVIIVGQENNLGLNALKMFEIRFDGCQVPTADHLGGDQPDFYDQFLQRTRIGMSALATGVGRASFEFVKRYAKERSQFGEPIAHRQSVAFMVAEMAYEVDAMRLLTWQAASKIQAQKDAARAAYLAKLYAGEKVMKVCDYGVQVMGGHGYIREYPVEGYYRNSRGVSILEGLAIV